MKQIAYFEVSYTFLPCLLTSTWVRLVKVSVSFSSTSSSLGMTYLPRSSSSQKENHMCWSMTELPSFVLAMLLTNLSDLRTLLGTVNTKALNYKQYIFCAVEYGPVQRNGDK